MKIREQMEKLITESGSKASCCSSSVEEWKPLTTKARRSFARLPEALQVYLREGLPDKALKTSTAFECKSALLKNINCNVMFVSALSMGYLPLAHRDADYFCCHLESGTVHFIAGWCFAERKLEVERRYKTVETWLTSMIRREREAKKRKVRKAQDAKRLEGNPNSRDKNSRHQLWLHLIKGNVEGVRAEIGRRAKLEYRDTSGDTPLIYSVRRRKLEIFKLLLEAGANVKAKTEDGGSLRWQAEFYFESDPEVLALCDQYEIP